MGLVKNIDVEMPESFLVSLSLDNIHGGRIRLNEARNEGEVEIIDDDGTVDIAAMHNNNIHVLFCLSEAVIGLNQTSYQLNNGADEVTVCAHISRLRPVVPSHSPLT